MVDPEAQPNEWVVEKIHKHRRNGDGKLEFLTKWEGYTEEDNTWEPVDSFIHRYNNELVGYCQRHNLPINLMEYLSPIPPEVE